MFQVFYSTAADFNGDGALNVAGIWSDGLYVHFNSEVNKLNNVNNMIIKKVMLSQNYPNPFNSETAIQFFLPKPGIVNSLIYDINGKEVSSGVYLTEMKTGSFREVRKMLLIK